MNILPNSKWIECKKSENFVMNDPKKPWEGIEYSPRPGGMEKQFQPIENMGGIKDNGSDFGEINVVSAFENKDSFTLKKGETAVIDFGQNIVALPDVTRHIRFCFRPKTPPGCIAFIRVRRPFGKDGIPTLTSEDSAT